VPSEGHCPPSDARSDPWTFNPGPWTMAQALKRKLAARKVWVPFGESKPFVFPQAFRPPPEPELELPPLKAPVRARGT
jgi:hypothetical protein